MKTAFMFSGQGAQYPGMGKELYDNYECCRDIFDRADCSLGYSISSLCFNGGDDLNKTEFTQPAVLTTGIAAYSLLEKEKIVPDYVLGLSLGEYSALVASGALSFDQAVPLVRKRGQYMAESCPEGIGAMSAIMDLSRELIIEVCREASSIGVVSPANYNMPGQVVIAGEVMAVVKAEELALAKGAKRCIRLNVSGAFHTRLLASASQLLNKELGNVEIRPMAIPVISNLTGEVIPNEGEIIDTLTKQVMSSVLWEDSINKAISLGVDVFVELGPGKALSGFVKKTAIKNNKEVSIYNIENVASLEATISKIKG